MGSKAPKAPDYSGAAAADREASQNIALRQTEANRPDQYTPWGSSTWESYEATNADGTVKTDINGQPLTGWTQNFNLTDNQQAAFDAQEQQQIGRNQLGQQLTGQAAQEMGTPLDRSQLPQMANTPDVPTYGNALSQFGSLPNPNQSGGPGVPGAPSYEGLSDWGETPQNTLNTGDLPGRGQAPQQPGQPQQPQGGGRQAPLQDSPSQQQPPGGGTGGPGQPAPPGDQRSVEGLYSEILGREGGQAGMDYWQGQLDSGAMNMDQVREGFINSPENQGRENPYQQGDGGQTSTQPATLQSGGPDPFAGTPQAGTGGIRGEAPQQPQIRPAKTAENNTQMANQKAMADKRAANGLPPLEQGGGMMSTRGPASNIGSGVQQGPASNIGSGVQQPAQQQPAQQGGEQGDGAIRQQNDPYGPGQIQNALRTEGMQDVDAGGGYQDRFAETQYDRNMSLQQPQMDRDTQAMENRLRNQGLQPGSESYDNAMNDLRNQQGEVKGRASQDAVAAGGREQQNQFNRESQLRGQQFGERGQQGQFANQAGQQDFSQRMQGGGQRFNQQLQGGQFAEQQRAAAMNEQGQQFNQGLQQQQAANAQRGQQFDEWNQLNAAQGGAAQAAYDRQMQTANMQDRQRQQMLNEQLALGGQGFDQRMQAANYQNTLRQQGLAEDDQRRFGSINAMNALQSGQQVGMPTMPSFQAAQQGRAVNNAAMAAQNAGNFAQQGYGTTMGFYGDLASAAGSASPSDARLKNNITKIGDYGPLDVVSWTWNGLLGLAGNSMGFIAQQVQEFYPEHVVTMSNGYLAIDYDALLKEV